METEIGQWKNFIVKQKLIFDNGKPILNDGKPILDNGNKLWVK